MSRLVFILSFLSFFLYSCQQGDYEATLATIPAEDVDQLNFKPAEQFFLQRLSPEHPFSVQRYNRALKQATREKLQKSQSPGFDGDWITHGPANIGARVNTVAVHPADEAVIYIGYSTGGVFKTTDGGENWTPVFDDQPFMSIGDIAIDPQNPNVVYVGTGDPNISGYPFIGNGVYRSTDAGLTWEHLGLEQQSIVSKVLLHPQNAKIIYAATMGLPFVRNQQRGLYRSLDGGNSWTQILFVDEGAGTIDLIMDPTDPDVLYAVSWDRIRNNQETIVQGPNSGIYKSTDGGDNWSRLSTDLPQGETGRIALAISASNPKVLAALFLNKDDEVLNIYRTENAGQNWQAIIDHDMNNGLPSRPLGNLGWYLGRIAINPADDEDIFMLGVRLWRSRDNGLSWKRATNGSVGIHADNHDMVFSKAGTIYLATDGGLYRSLDNGERWVDRENIATTQFYRTAYNPHKPDWYYGGAQDNGSVGGVSLEENWNRILGADGFQFQFHPDKPDVFYAEIQGGGIYYTDDNGRRWKNGTIGIDDNDRRHWDAPYQISAHNPSVLYTGTYRLYQSVSDSFPRWNPISDDLTRGNIWGGRFNTISTLHESPVDAQLLYTGSTDGMVWRTDDGGQNWKNITVGLPDRYVTSIKASPIDDQRIVVTHSGYKDNDFTPYIHLSDNRGETWIPIGGNLPPLAINDVYILPGFEDDIIFAATDGGVYATINRGRTWERLGINMPMVPVYDLEWNPDQKAIVAATFGRSIQSYPLEELVSYWENTVSVEAPIVAVSLHIYPNPASDWLKVQNLPSTGSQINILNTAGQPVYRNPKVAEENLEITISEWPAGVYYVVVGVNGGRQTASFVKL